MKDCYYDLGLHFILLYDYSQSYILKLRDRWPSACDEFDKNFTWILPKHNI